jgi:hypothetical protein
MESNNYTEYLNNLKSVYDIFVSYQFTGIDAVTRRANVEKLMKMFIGKKVFCSEFHEEEFRRQGMTTENMYDFCLEIQKNCKEVLFLIAAPNESKGMKLELDLAIKNNIPGKLIILNELQYLDWVQPFIKYCWDEVEIIKKF